MRFWIREIAGWLLVLLGLFVFYICFLVLLGAQGSLLFEAIFLTVIGVVVFRAGIHLLKVAVAARVCLHAQTQLRDQERQLGGRSEGRSKRTGRGRTAETQPAGRFPVSPH